jgi:hypothetical protein
MYGYSRLSITSHAGDRTEGGRLSKLSVRGFFIEAHFAGTGPRMVAYLDGLLSKRALSSVDCRLYTTRKQFPNSLILGFRWLSSLTDKQKLAYLSFGMGPRTCIGMRLAYMELKLTLLQILKNYNVLACQETEASFKIILFSGVVTELFRLWL